MRNIIHVILIISLCVTGVFNVKAEEPHPFNANDLVGMDRVSSHQVSPDGKQIVFVIRKTDWDANKGRTDLWLIGSDGNHLRRLTADPAADYNPLWSKDGKNIYFLSTRSGSSQVWRMAVDGGEAFQVTSLPLDVDNLKLSPDGTKMAFTMHVFPGTTPDETVKKIADKEKCKATGRIYEKLFFRHWDTWEDGTRSHVFVASIDGQNPVDVMKDVDADSPLKPFGGSEEFSFTPDSKSIVYTADSAGIADAWSTNYDLYLVPVEGNKAAENLTEANKAWDTTPVFSNDGKTMAYLRMSRPGYEADKFEIVLRQWPNGSERVLTKDWDRSTSGFTWGPKDKTIYATADHLGQHPLFTIDVKTAKVNILVSGGQASGPDINGQKVFYSLNHLKSPTEIYCYDLKKKTSTPITKINADKLANIKMGDFEQFTFKGWNNEDVYAYLVKPVDFDANKKYPIAYLIHGGPQGSFGNDFHYRWNPQSYTGRGYAAVMVDFHGSTGYGQAFTDSIATDWGGKPFEDLKKGLAAAIEKYPFLDRDRVCALGASYGGYMINWIAGNWPDRFRCLVSHDGNLDERAAYYDTEELWFPEWEHGGTPWDNPEGYEKHNPTNFVKNWKTPMLVIHGGQDFRVVETQGMSTFTALQRKGIPSKFLYFPDENHWVLKPHNSILWHKTVLDWLDQWTKK